MAQKRPILTWKLVPAGFQLLASGGGGTLATVWRGRDGLWRACSTTATTITPGPWTTSGEAKREMERIFS